jgi:hypothetical protein
MKNKLLEFEYTLQNIIIYIKAKIGWFFLTEEEKTWEEFNRDYVKYNRQKDI